MFSVAMELTERFFKKAFRETWQLTGLNPTSPPFGEEDDQETSMSLFGTAPGKITSFGEFFALTPSGENGRAWSVVRQNSVGIKA
jgi:hypothetical protein